MSKKKSMNGESINVVKVGSPADIQGGTKPRNRIKSKGELREQLLHTDPTKDYVSTRYQYYGELFVNNLPLWRIWTARMMLTSDPIVNFSMNIRNAALMAADVKVTSPREEVRKFVQEQWDYLWNHHRPKLVSAKKWGFAGLQPLFKTDKQGGIKISGLKDFAPEDLRALERKNKLCGIRVKGNPVFFPQALWISFGSEFGNHYGTAVTRRQYPAWYEKWMDHGAKRLLQLRMVKDAYIGDIFWYPPNMIIELPDGTKVPWKDLMREIGENRLSGGALTLPRLYDNQGKELTGYTPPQDIGGATTIFDWVGDCDDNILKGADIPAEVVQAADTGSGFSGRSIPFLVLLSVCTNELIEIVQAVDQCLLRNLVWLRFGSEAEYEIEPASLVESFSADISGSSLAGGSIGGAQGQPPQQVQQQQPPQQYSEEKRVDLIPGGKGDKAKESDFDKEQIKMGVKVEMEHTNDPHVALEICLDHLSEDPHYYTKLKQVEQHAENHKFSCLMFVLPPELASGIRQLQKEISPKDLAEDGVETEPHVTIKYGLTTNNSYEVAEALNGESPVAIQIGKCSLFENDEHDVLKLEVRSDGLHRLNSKVCKSLEIGNDIYPDYIPHITVAYLKPGTGKKYVSKLNDLMGKVAVFKHMTFSNQEKTKTLIELQGDAQFSEGEHSLPFGELKEHESQKLHEWREHLWNRGTATSLAKRAVHGGDLHHLHPGEITVYRGVTKGASRSKGRSWSKSRKVAEKYAEGGHVESLRLTKHHAAIDVNKALRHIPSKSESDQEVFVHQHNSQHEELEEWQFDENRLLKSLRQLITRGYLAARSRVNKAAAVIRGFLGLEKDLQTLAGDMEHEIRLIQPGLTGDLGIDMLSGALEGSLGVLRRLPSTLTLPQSRSVIEPAREVITQPSILPSLPELTEVLFPEPTQAEVHLPALEEAVTKMQKSPVAVGHNYRETAQHVAKGSFAITGDLTEKAVEDVKQELAKTIAEGKTQAEFIETVATRLEKEGSPLAPPHLENVFRTNTMAAYSNAQAKAVENPMVSDAFPYASIFATQDSRVRKEHWALESLGLDHTNVYRTDDPVFQKYRGPWDFNCRCTWTPTTVEQAARKGVKEAIEWLNRAKKKSEIFGGSFYQYLTETAPSITQHVNDPGFTTDFKRDMANV